MSRKQLMKLNRLCCRLSAQIDRVDFHHFHGRLQLARII